MNASARIETRAEVGSEVHFSHDVSERLVTTDEEMTAKTMAPSGTSSGVEQPTPRRRTFLTPLPRRRPSPGAAGTTTPFDHNVTSRGERTQQGVHQATPTPESMTTDQEQLASLQHRAAMAEATARLLAAEQATAHLLAAREREDTLSRQSRSRSRTPPSSPGGQPTSELARLVQFFGDRDTRLQQAADEREARREQATAEREARREAQHAAQLAALRGSPPTGSPSCSFIPN